MTNETNREPLDAFPVEFIKEKTYLEVWESDLSRFVSAYYGRPWSMQQGEELGQNTYQEREVDSEPDEVWDADAHARIAAWLRLPRPPRGSGTTVLQQWELMMQRKHYISVEIILWDLCRKGVIPAGTYLIKVWW